MGKFGLCHILPIPLAYYESEEKAEDAVLIHLESYPEDDINIDDFYIISYD